MLNDVYTQITDGLRDEEIANGEGCHVKVGVSTVTGQVTIKKGMTTDKIRQLLGNSPLADSAIISVENGASKIYCFPVPASVQGTVGQVAKTGTGQGTCTVQGTPYNAFNVVVQITGKGGLNAALLRCSIDGGVSYGDELTIPIGGQMELANTGLTLKFAEASEGSDHFSIGDTFSFTTTAPAPSVQGVLDAVAAIKAFREEFEFVHVVGSSDSSVWAALATAQEELERDAHKAVYMLLEAYAPTSEQTLEEYVAALENDRSAVHNCNVQVCASRCLYQRGDGVTTEINTASIAAGQYSVAAPHVSIGMTREFAVSEARHKAARPVGIDAYLDRLDDAGYLTYRQYDGLTGWFVTNANMMAPDTSNYLYAEDVRIKNKLVRLLRKEALLQLQTSLDANDLQSEMDKIAKFVQVPADEMVRAGEISWVEVVVPDGQTLAKNQLNLMVRYKQRRILRSIVIDLGVLAAAQ